MSNQKINRNNINFKDFILPPLENSAIIFKNNYFSKELLPFNKNKERKIKIKCNNCNYQIESKWLINTTNLKSHLKLKHFLEFNKDNLNFELNENSINLDSSLTTNSNNLMDNYLTNLKVRKRPSFVLFNPEEYKDLLLKFLISNNLAFNILNNNSFNNLVKYLKDDLPSISRKIIKKHLDLLYNKELDILKLKLNNNTSKFTITLDEWNSFNNIDFLAITLHFYNNNFNLESYLIGFEDLTEFDSYTGNNLFNKVNIVLKTYNLRTKLLAITRDNASPINNLIELIQTKYNNKYNINIIDIKCFAHILNIITNTILTYLFFIPNNTKKFNKNINLILLENKEVNTNIYNKIKYLPNNIRSIINNFKYNYYLKNNFKRLIEKSKELDEDYINYETLIKDNSTRWLSTYNMLDRFITLQEEINEILNKINNSSNKLNINLETYFISTEEWDYLIIIRDILEIFRKPTIKLQTSKYSTIYYTIPYIHKLLNNLEEYLNNNYIKNNPFLSFALKEAKNKLLNYYPIRDTNITKLKDLYLTTVLNPQFKLEIFYQLKFNNIIIQKIKDYLLEIYKNYSLNYKTDDFQTVLNNNSNNISNLEEYDSDNDLFINENFIINKTEIELYLEEPRISQSINLIDYYKGNKNKYPILYLIVKDYLAIPATSAPSESIFSKAGDIITKKRNRLVNETIKKTILLKSWNIIENEDIDDNLDNILNNNNLQNLNKINLNNLNNLEGIAGPSNLNTNSININQDNENTIINLDNLNDLDESIYENSTDTESSNKLSINYDELDN